MTQKRRFVNFAMCLAILLQSTQLAASGKEMGGGEDFRVANRRNFIKNMMKDAWEAYCNHSWGQWSLDPVNMRAYTDAGIPQNTGLGNTIINALDTLFIMGMEEEFRRAKDWVVNQLDFSSVNAKVQINTAAEQLIAGLLSAYFLTHDDMFVRRAAELADLYLPSFNTSTGLPFRMLNLRTRDIVRGDTATYISELGTLHLEFLTLTNLTGKPDYAEKATKARAFLINNPPTDGLYRDTLDVSNGRPYRDIVSDESHFLGTFLNEWLQNGDEQARRLFDRALRAFARNDMIRLSRISGLQYITEMRSRIKNDIMPLEACMSGGVYALGFLSNATTSTVDFLSIGRNLTRTCREASNKTRTGLVPNKFRFNNALSDPQPESTRMWSWLEPELAYSYFVLYRLTGDPVYREWGWELVMAIEQHAKVNGGYSGLKNVMAYPAVGEHGQNPTFLGGTLKFLYLLFSERSFYSLGEWIFNAAGHLMPITGAPKVRSYEASSASNFGVTESSTEASEIRNHETSSTSNFRLKEISTEATERNSYETSSTSNFEVKKSSTDASETRSQETSSTVNAKDIDTEVTRVEKATVDKTSESLAAVQRTSGSTVVVSCAALLIFGAVVALVGKPYWRRVRTRLYARYGNSSRRVTRPLLPRTEGYEDSTFSI